MKSTEGKQGRVFVLRLEHGEVLHEQIEAFAEEKQIRAASLVVVGGADSGSRLVVGPEDGTARPISPMERALDGAHEITGTGTLFPDEEGNPRIHMHISGGRGDSVTTGCIRAGLVVWQMLEVVMTEITEVASVRKLDPAVGFTKLEP